MNNHKKGIPKGFNYIKNKKCLHCNGLIKPFAPSMNRKYCSNKCRTKINSLIVNKKCDICNNFIKPFQKLKNRKYCSKECSYKGFPRVRFNKLAADKITKKCIVCNKKIVKRASKSTNKDYWTCSRECRNINQTYQYCKICGNERIENTRNLGTYAFCRNCCISFQTLRNYFRELGIKSNNFLNNNKELIITYSLYQQSRRIKNELTNHPKRN